MQLKTPKNSDKYFWTEHSIFKMRQYGLSEQKVRSVIRNFDRREEGIVKNTVAVMQPVSPKVIDNKKTWKQELWVMYQSKVKNQKLKIKNNFIKNNQLKIISTWRYPGISPERDPIPEAILQELSEL